MVKPPPTFASLEGLLDHGRRDGFDIRPTLLRVLTDLYLQKAAHPLEDERYYTELTLRLIGSAAIALPDPGRPRSGRARMRSGPCRGHRQAPALERDGGRRSARRTQVAHRSGRAL